MTRRLRLAIPNKGRLVDPTLRLLHDAGLVFEEHDRSLVARVSNFDLDILFVRTSDVVEFVGDGVADLGITGRDLLTLGELRDLALRWSVARLLDAGMHYAEISQRTGASTATITRIASWLHHGEGGYRLMLDRLRAAGTLPYPTAGVDR